MSKKVIVNAIIDAGLTALYVALVGAFFFNVEHLFGPGREKDTVLAPIMMLLLLVISAAITGCLVFGRPVIWYLDGQKHQALWLLGMTLLFLALIAASLILGLMLGF